jgi:hypothetical protein
MGRQEDEMSERVLRRAGSAHLARAPEVAAELAVKYHRRYSREFALDMDAQREVCALRRAGLLRTYTQASRPSDILILMSDCEPPGGWVPTQNWWA